MRSIDKEAQRQLREVVGSVPKWEQCSSFHECYSAGYTDGKRRGRAEERERCAQIAEEHAKMHQRSGAAFELVLVDGGKSAEVMEYCALASNEIAVAIRGVGETNDG